VCTLFGERAEIARVSAIQGTVCLNCFIAVIHGRYFRRVFCPRILCDIDPLTTSRSAVLSCAVSQSACIPTLPPHYMLFRSGSICSSKFCICSIQSKGVRRRAPAILREQFCGVPPHFTIAVQQPSPGFTDVYLARSDYDTCPRGLTRPRANRSLPVRIT
jgi:hypothetical protein